MQLLLIGLLLLGFGCSLIFAREAWWAVQEFSNQMKGQASERTLVWDVSQMGVGVVAIAIAIALIWQGIDKISQPVVPGICTTVEIMSALDDLDKFGIKRDIETGCAAAEKKDYETALSNFRRAFNNLDRQPSFLSYRQPLYKAIEQMKQQVPKS